MKIALVAIAKNEDNYIDEWVDYNYKLGFDDIIIYLNNWRYDFKNKKVKTIEFDGHAKQMSAYNHFIQNNTEYDWVAFFDVDEFLVLKKYNNIHDFINYYKNFNGIAVNWYLFGDNHQEKVIDNNYNVLSRFTKREEKPNVHIKSIMKLTKDLKMITPHSSNKIIMSPEFKQISGPFNHSATNNIAQLNHYFCKTFEEFKLKVERGRSDTGGIRNLDEFHSHNKNEIEDLLALNFINKF